jgi:hypothetical protein
MGIDGAPFLVIMNKSQAIILRMTFAFHLGKSNERLILQGDDSGSTCAFQNRISPLKAVHEQRVTANG